MQSLDKKRIREDFSNAASSYDAAAVVQNEICERTLERLQMLRLEPDTILDIGSGTGKSVRALKSFFPKAHVIASDFALPMLIQSNCKPAICCDAQMLPLNSACVDLIFSTSTFQWCEDLNHLFAECARILKPDGTLIFSTFGPDTLKELRQSWAQIDEQTHVHDFIDMHHIGDILLANHYHDPVVDREMIVIEYQSIKQLMRDLKATGSRGKFSHSKETSGGGLTGKEKLNKMLHVYNTFRMENDSLPASYEVIYGYARQLSDNSSGTASSEIKIPIDKISK